MKKTLEGLLEKADKLRNNGRVDESIRTYLELADISKGSERFDYTARALHMAGVSAKMAVSRSDSTKYRDALKYFFAAEKVYTELGMTKHLGDLFRDIAILNTYAKLKADALKYFQKSIEILEKMESFGSLAITYDKLGLYHHQNDDLSSAKKSIEKALELFKKDPDKGFFHATTWLDYAKILAKEGDINGAIEWAEQSLNWYQADHEDQTFDRRRAQLYGMLSVLYDQVGREKNAKNYASKYEKLLKGFDPDVSQVLRDKLRRIFSR